MPAAGKIDRFAADRRMMVDCQLRTFEVTDHAILAAFDTVPRETFVAPACQSLAYGDMVLPDASALARNMLVPMVLARMVQALEVQPGDRVLDIAGGSGYGAAILCELGAVVTTLEAQAVVATGAAPKLTVVAGDIFAGVPAGAPFDAMLLHGAVEVEPATLVRQLRDGGRLICGDSSGQVCKIVCFERFGTGVRKKILFDGVAPPLPEFAAKPEFAF